MQNLCNNENEKERLLLWFIDDRTQRNAQFFEEQSKKFHVLKLKVSVDEMKDL